MTKAGIAQVVLCSQGIFEPPSARIATLINPNSVLNIHAHNRALAMAGHIGARLDPAPTDLAPHAFWFGEDQARYVVTSTAAQIEAILARAPSF